MQHLFEKTPVNGLLDEDESQKIPAAHANQLNLFNYVGTLMTEPYRLHPSTGRRMLGQNPMGTSNAAPRPARAKDDPSYDAGSVRHLAW